MTGPVRPFKLKLIRARLAWKDRRYLGGWWTAWRWWNGKPL